MKIIDNINVLLKYKIILVDQWGVIHNGKKKFVKSCNALKFLKKNKKKIILISNAAENTNYNKKHVLKKLKIFDDIYDYSVTSGEIFEENINLLKKKLNKNFLNCYLISHLKKNNLKNLGLRFKKKIKESDFILACSIKPDAHINTYYNLLKKSLKYGKLMICINPDKKVFDGKLNKLVWQIGKLAEYYENSGGKVLYFGKPYPKIFEKCLHVSKCKNKKKAIIIGDSIDNDILGGQKFGIDTMLIRNGKHINQLKNKSLKSLKVKIKKLNPNNKLPTYLINQMI